MGGVRPAPSAGWGTPIASGLSTSFVHRGVHDGGAQHAELWMGLWVVLCTKTGPGNPLWGLRGAD